MFRSKLSRLALMAFAFALPLMLAERIPAPEQASAETPAVETPAAESAATPSATV